MLIVVNDEQEEFEDFVDLDNESVWKGEQMTS